MDIGVLSHIPKIKNTSIFPKRRDENFKDFTTSIWYYLQLLRLENINNF
jgi:hypothetical protein